MKKKILIVLLIPFFVLAIPAAAKTKEPVGQWISLGPASPTEFDANTAFHIIGGVYLWLPDDVPIGLYEFKLELDGVYLEEDFVDRFVDDHDPTTLGRIWVFNFPEGLPSGTYTFTGHFIVPCEEAVE
jgi:hypothetical protein